MTETNENSKRRFTSSAMAAALILASRFSLGRLSHERSKKTKLQQLILVIAMYVFIIPVIYSTAQMLNQASVQSSQSSQSASPTPAQPDTIQAALAAQIRGYELVLKREPHNLTALEGLATTKLQVKDYAGAIEILQELVKRYPERSDYAAMLAEAQQKAGQPGR